MMRDEMKINDLVLFYHSNTKPHPHIAGVAKVVREGMALESNDSLLYKFLYNFYFEYSTLVYFRVLYRSKANKGYPDFTSWDKKSKYYDAKSTEAKPRWFMVDVEPVESLKEIVTLQDVKEHPKLTEMALIKKGQRLSIQRVTEDQYEIIRKLGGLE